MKLLMITHGISMANSTIALRVAKEWSETGHESWVLGAAPTQECPESAALHFAGGVQDTSASDRFVALCGGAGASPGRKLRCALAHPVCAWHTYVTQTTAAYNRRLCRQAVRLCRENGIDCAVVLSLPFVPAQLLCGRLPCRLALYQVDPYALAADLTPAQRAPRIAEERAVFEHCAHIFTTPLLLAEYEVTELAAYAPKMTAVEFPCIVDLAGDGRDDFVYPEGAVVGVYAGTLASDIRNLDCMESVLDAAFSQMPQLCVRFIGKRFYGAMEKLVRKWPGRVFLSDRMDRCDANAAMQRADFLINIGFNVFNQLPSKTLDYISTGKPIVNFYELPHCPTLPYMEKYPHALCLDFAADAQESAARLVEFCRSLPDAAVPFAEVERLFWDGTPQAVAQQIVKKLSD